ncbi:MAG TPA: GntR family transcriptional regulator [Petrotogaceae bacterium]|nr:GntR family transcriptional regulator [Petrotogaceae bacterium]
MADELHSINDGKSVVSRTYEALLKYVNNPKRSGEKLPSEIELSKQLKVSRTALRDALKKLELEGYISRKRKTGTFINCNNYKLHGGLEKLRSITELIKTSGMRPGTIFSKYSTDNADNIISQKLGLADSSRVSIIERVRTADDTPFCYEISFVPISYFNQEDYENFSGSLLSYLSEKKGLVVDHAVTYLNPYSSDDLISEKLSIKNNQLIMYIEQVHYSVDDEPIWYSRAFYRNDIIRFSLMRRL